MWKGFPLSLIMADQYRTIDRIGAVQAPLLIVHGGRDAIIPLDQARHVFHAAAEPKSMVVVPQAGHNDLFERGAWEKVRGFLGELAAGAGGHGRAADGDRRGGNERGALDFLGYLAREPASAPSFRRKPKSRAAGTGTGPWIPASPV